MMDEESSVPRRKGSFDWEEEEFEEVLGLISSSSAEDHRDQQDDDIRRGEQHDKINKRWQVNDPNANNRAWRWWLVTILFVTVASHYFYKHAEDEEASPVSSSLNYDCPRYQVPFDNFDRASIDRYSFTVDKYTQDLRDFKSKMHSYTFDKSERTYDEFKASIRDWVVETIVPHLKTGDSIYGSECGVGLNLYATLEILKEEADIKGIHVYGSDYSESNVRVAKRIFEEVPPSSARKGIFCEANPTKLSFIPSNSFQLVSTGYLSPLLDPIQLHKDRDDSHSYSELCTVKTDNWKGEKLRFFAQDSQNEWVVAWIGEMVRIAAPGAPIVVENMSPEFCAIQEGWGGVSKEFWKQAIETHGWDVDVSSLSFGKYTPTSAKSIESDKWKYHVSFRKNENP